MNEQKFEVSKSIFTSANTRPRTATGAQNFMESSPTIKAPGAGSLWVILYQSPVTAWVN